MPAGELPAPAEEWRSVSDITIVRAGALGDFVATLPALRALAGENRRLHLVGNASVARALTPDLFASIRSIEDPTAAFLFDDGAPPPGLGHPGDSPRQARRPVSLRTDSAAETNRADSVDYGAAPFSVEPTDAAVAPLAWMEEAAIVIALDPAIERRVGAVGWRPTLFVPAHPPPELALTVAAHLVRGAGRATLHHPSLAHVAKSADLDPSGVAGTALCLPSLDQPTIYPHPDAIARADGVRRDKGVGARYATIHPGSGSPRKNWPIDRFGAIASLLHAHGVEPVFLTGPADGDLRRQIAAIAALAASRGASTIVDSTAAPVLDDLDLPTLAGLISQARCHVGNDSGISHLAAGLGAPTVVIYGSTRAARWLPAGPYVTAVEPSARCPLCAASERLPVACDCLATVSVEAVWRTIAAVLDGEGA